MTHQNRKTLAEEIREARQAKGLTQAQLAKMAGLSRGQNAISEIENGRLEAAYSRIQAIREALGLT